MTLEAAWRQTKFRWTAHTVVLPLLPFLVVFLLLPIEAWWPEPVDSAGWAALGVGYATVVALAIAHLFATKKLVLIGRQWAANGGPSRDLSGFWVVSIVETAFVVISVLLLLLGWQNVG